jgi:hypothetical protein
LGAVHFHWHPDRIEISSPGGFPEGVRLDNLLVTAPRPRNPLLADAFKRAGIVERTARGIDTIFYEQLRTTYANAASSRCNRNRWCCNTWKSTDALPGVKRPSCVGFRPIRPIACSLGWRKKGGSYGTVARRGLGMSAAHKITARGYPVTVRAYITGRGGFQTGSNRLEKYPNALRIKWPGVSGKPTVLANTENARVHLFARRAYSLADADVRKHLPAPHASRQAGGHVLTPGRYVGAEAAEDDGEPFEDKMKRLTATLREQQKEAACLCVARRQAKLNAAIAANLKELGYGG